MGLVEDRWTEGLRARGADRARFLNGYLTCDVVSLEPAAGAYGFFTSAQGRILGDAVVTAGSDETRLAVPRGRAAPLLEHLGRYILADRVELSAVDDETTWLLGGEGLPELATALFGGLPEGVGDARTARLAGSEIRAVRRLDLAVPVCAVYAATVAAGSVGAALLAAGARPVADSAWEARRVVAGVPRYGVDFDDGNFPQETGIEEAGLERAVSYTKGCYLGQEVVARIHYRGHVNRQLRGLVFEGEAPPPGTPLTHEGEEVGRLGSVATTAVGAIGLAILHRKAVAPGTLLMAGGCVARVEAVGLEPVPRKGEG